MREDQSSAAVPHHTRQNLGKWEIHARHIAIEAFEIETVSLLIEVGNPKAFACLITP